MSRKDGHHTKPMNDYIPGILDLNPINNLEESLFAPKDWSYAMRRDMQEIIPGLYLGPYSSASKSKLNSLLSSEITHVICVRQVMEAHIIKPNFPDNFMYLTIDLADTMVENIIPSIAKCREFIDSCLDVGGKCLVHSYLGISRSPSIVVAYIMRKCSYSCREALGFVKAKRHCVNPNEHFLKQLLEYEAIYKAEQTASEGQCSQANSKLKRKLDTDKDTGEPMDLSNS